MDIQVELHNDSGRTLRNGMSLCEVTVPALDIRQYLHLPFTELHRFFGAPEGVPADLMVVAGCCYVIDQIIPRSAFSDNWTRDLDVLIPVENSSRWAELAPRFSAMLTFLTGDRWRMRFSERGGPLYWHRHRRLRRVVWQPTTTVCLFSGGLDSFVGAADRLALPGERVFLVGHHDLGSLAANLQAQLFAALSDIYGLQRLELFRARIGPLGKFSRGILGGPAAATPYPLENTLRSRSLVFLALALYVAQQQDFSHAVPVLIPENGMIALNPPLTPSRIGSCRTRTAHPVFLREFADIVNQLGMSNPILNPYAWKTKGQVLAEAADLELVQRYARSTVSCAHPTRRGGWVRRTARNCGYCVPCLFRRAAMHCVGMDNGNDYGIDIGADELPLDANIAVNLRALLSWVYDMQAAEQAQRAAESLALPSTDFSQATLLLSSTAEEVTQWLRAKAPKVLRFYAGLE